MKLFMQIMKLFANRIIICNNYLQIMKLFMQIIHVALSAVSFVFRE